MGKHTLVWHLCLCCFQVMDGINEDELHEAVAGLGNWHEIPDKTKPGEKQWTYLVKRDECLDCLRDLRVLLKNDGPETGNVVTLKLGQWKVVKNHIIPLFEAYRDDLEISVEVLQFASKLSMRLPASVEEQGQHLEFLQDYKEAFSKKDIFIILMRMIVENMEEDEENVDNNQDAPPRDRKQVFEALLTLLRNLVSTPDPLPGEPGFSPSRKNLQNVYIKLFIDESFLDFILLYAETLEEREDPNKDQAWALLDILYHICTQVNPEDLTRSRKAKDKGSLALLLDKVSLSQGAKSAPSRHSRFGTQMVHKSATSGMTIKSSVSESITLTKGSKAWRKEFQDRAGSEKKKNVFHDVFFVDLEEGSARDHNRINVHARNALEAPNDVGDAALAGLQKFFEDFVQSSFSKFVSDLRGTCTASNAKAVKGERLKEHDRPKVLNFVSWILELHRYQHAAEAAKAKKTAPGTAPVEMDIASIQGAIDLDMVQFVTARLREHGKAANLNASQLVIALRALSQQLKTIAIVVDSKNTQVRDIGEILLQNIVKDDVMAHLEWIMRHFVSSSHDPRVLSYTVEVYHFMLRLMHKVMERQGQKQLEFQIERSSGRGTTSRGATTAEKEVAKLGDGRIVENLFYLLEKYKRLTPQSLSMVVKLIYKIIKATPTNIVAFFELPYFIRIQRIVNDPVVKYAKPGKGYDELAELMRYILRQFFKCAETNGLVFAELLFRKVVENQNSSLLMDNKSEFAAILDNYEDEDYKRIMDKMEAGESLSSARARQKAANEGNEPWSAEEDALLKDRYHVYRDHPLVAELLASELPEESRRTARQVRTRLKDLGILGGKGFGRGDSVDEGGGGGGGQADNARDVDLDSPAKRRRLDENSAEVEADLEAELENLLDAAADTFDTDPFFDAGAPAGGVFGAPAPAAGGASSSTAPAAAPAPAGAFSEPPEVDLEMELAAMLEEGDQDSLGVETFMDPPTQGTAARLPAAAPAVARPAAETMMEDDEDAQGFWEGIGAAESGGPAVSQRSSGNQGADSLELELETMFDEQGAGDDALPAASATQHSARGSQESLDLEGDLENIMDDM
jgi:hypothetical protein